MNRHSEIVTTDRTSIETYLDGEAASGLDVVVLPSYGRDGGEDFDAFSAVLAAGHRVLRPQPRGIARTTGPMTGVSIDELVDDVAPVIDRLGRGAVILGHGFGNFVARTVATGVAVGPRSTRRTRSERPGSAEQ